MGCAWGKRIEEEVNAIMKSAMEVSRNETRPGMHSI